MNMNENTENQPTEDVQKGRVVVNINMKDCTTTLAPAADQAIQVVNVYGRADDKMPEMHTAPVAQAAGMPQEPAEEPAVSAAAIRLRKYCDDDKSWTEFLSYIRTCKSATELAKVIVDMERSQSHLLKDDSTRQSFLDIIVSLAVGVGSGRTVGNIRQRVYDAQRRKKK